MRNPRRLLALGLVLSALLGGCAAGPKPAAEEWDVPIVVRGQDFLQGASPPIAFTQVHTPEEIVDWIKTFRGRPGVRIDVIGESLLGRPIHHVTVGQGPFDLWVIGRHHGNEPTGGEAIMLALQALTDPDPNLPHSAPESFRQMVLLRDLLLERVTFHFVPVANPDGAAAYTRGNAAGADLNREYFLFTQPEPVAVRERFWAVQPDGCIDLHNEGVGGTDWDAFGPDGPMIEPEIFNLIHRDVDLALWEVDAAGGRGGDYNEFYNLVYDAPVVGDVVNPTAYHPGTHDLFCSVRGAPGYTPEGAISGESGNGVSGPVMEWSTRLHQVTIAAAAFHWAGLYDAVAPELQKFPGRTGQVEVPEGHQIPVNVSAHVRLQLVWRTQDVANDWEPSQLEMAVIGTDGSIATYAAEPRGMAWTNTVELGPVGPGNLSVSVQGPPGVPYELRAHLFPDSTELVTVAREGTNLRVRAVDGPSLPVHFRLTDVFDPPLPGLGDFEPFPEHLETYPGTVDERVIARWELVLEAGQETLIQGPTDRVGAGPYRWTAVSGAFVQMGVEPVRNAAE